MAIPFISPTDIGRFAAFVMLNQDRFQHGMVQDANASQQSTTQVTYRFTNPPVTTTGEVVPIAGDVVTPQQFVEAFARLKGVQVRVRLPCLICVFWCSTSAVVCVFMKCARRLDFNTHPHSRRQPTRSSPWTSSGSCPSPARTSSWRCTSGTTPAAPVRLCGNIAMIITVVVIHPMPNR